jgi:hypothetical protein
MKFLYIDKTDICFGVILRRRQCLDYIKDMNKPWLASHMRLSSTVSASSTSRLFAAPELVKIVICGTDIQ